MQDMENWRDIKGFEDRYEVSDHGRVRSKDITFKMHQGQQTRKGRVLKPSIGPDGYHRVELSDGTRRHEGGRRHRKMVHLLVLHAFKSDEYFEGATGDHVNFDKDDNRAISLEWVTQKENNNRKIRAGRGNNQKGSEQPQSKLTEADIPVIFERRAEGLTYKAIGEEFGVTGTKIAQIIYRQNWAHVNIEPRILNKLKQ